MLLDRLCWFYEVHDFDAFYVTTILLWKHMRYPSEKSEVCMECVESFKHPHFCFDDPGGISGLNLLYHLLSFSSVSVVDSRTRFISADTKARLQRYKGLADLIS